MLSHVVLLVLGLLVAGTLQMMFVYFELASDGQSPYQTRLRAARVVSLRFGFFYLVALTFGYEVVNPDMLSTPAAHVALVMIVVSFAHACSLWLKSQDVRMPAGEYAGSHERVNSTNR